MNRYCIYIRVSTKKQGNSGLGLAAQQKMCEDYVAAHGGVVLEIFQDVESGTHRNRPGLWNALEFCRTHSTMMDQCTLVIAKLDRLARDVEFVFSVVNKGVQIVFCDMPQVNTMVLGVFASVAQYERELCSSRTKSALDEIKENIEKNGGHMTPRGRWITHLGGKKGEATPEAALAAGISAHNRSEEWRSKSPLFLWVENQLIKGRSRQEILAEAEQMYKKNPSLYGTRNGCVLTKGTLSRWAKELGMR